MSATSAPSSRRRASRTISGLRSSPTTRRPRCRTNAPIWPGPHPISTTGSVEDPAKASSSARSRGFAVQLVEEPLFVRAGDGVVRSAQLVPCHRNVLSGVVSKNREMEPVEVFEAPLEEKSVVRRLLELYQYDFSEFVDGDLDRHGTYGYQFLDNYWTEPARHPFLFRVGGKWAGFALVRAGAPHDMAEFFVMRKYRRHGVGIVAARELFARFPGELAGPPDGGEHARDELLEAGHPLPVRGRARRARDRRNALPCRIGNYDRRRGRPARSISCCSISGACSSSWAASHRCASSPASTATTSCGGAGSRAVGCAASSAGECSADDFAAGVITDWGLAVEPEAFLDVFRSWPIGPLAGADALVRRVRDAVPVGCLSNTNVLHWDDHFTEWPIFEAFDFRFLSFELGIVKPDRDVVRPGRRAAAEPARTGPVPRRQRHQRRGRPGGRLRRRYVARGVDEATDALVSAGVLRENGVRVRARRRDRRAVSSARRAPRATPQRSSSGPECATTSTQPATVGAKRSHASAKRWSSTSRPHSPVRLRIWSGAKKNDVARRARRRRAPLLVGDAHHRVVHQPVAEVRARCRRGARRSRRRRGTRSGRSVSSSDTASYATTRS